jgi:hypothetical protein
LNPVPVTNFASPDILDPLACLSQQAPIDNLEFLALHVAQLTCIVADQARRIDLLEESLAEWEDQHG